MDADLDYEKAARGTDAIALIDSLRAAKEGDEFAQKRVAAAMTWVAFSCPGAIKPVYDTIAQVWHGSEQPPRIPENLPQAPLEARFWTAFWEIVGKINDRRLVADTKKALARVSDLERLAHPSLLEFGEELAARELAGLPPGNGTLEIDPDRLAACPAGTLGGRLHEMMVGDGYNVEYVAQKVRGFQRLPPSLRDLNTRVELLHRAWELVAGYGSKSSHELVFSAFLTAQCAHLLSAMVLAVCGAAAHFVAQGGFFLLMFLIGEGWRHGRLAPPLLGIDWNSEWTYPVDEIRRRHEIPVYDSVFSDNLFRAISPRT